MLDRAAQRIRPPGGEQPAVTTCQSDIRELELGQQTFDIVMAARCCTIFAARSNGTTSSRGWGPVRPGGSFWIADLVTHDDPRLEQ